MKSFNEFRRIVKESAEVFEEVTKQMGAISTPTMRDFVTLTLKECQNKGILFEETVTGDMAQFTPPLKMVRRNEPDKIVFSDAEEKDILDEYNLPKDELKESFGNLYPSFINELIIAHRGKK